MRGGKQINGRWFTETYSSGEVRRTHRFFIDGKLVSKAKFAEEMKAATAAEKEAAAIVARHNAEGGPALLRQLFPIGGKA
jgi:hypothetical protein